MESEVHSMPITAASGVISKEYNTSKKTSEIILPNHLASFVLEKKPWNVPKMETKKYKIWNFTAKTHLHFGNKNVHEVIALQLLNQKGTRHHQKVHTKAFN